MDIYVLVAVAVLSSMAGFWAGRSMRWQLKEAQEPESESKDSLLEKQEQKRLVKALSKYWEVGSPITGEYEVVEEQGCKTVHIRSHHGKVYAPVSGKITRLYPMGRELVLCAEFGAEIHIEAGRKVDEMCSSLYRCRVMENEVVRKGALMLEYDAVSIEAAGGDSEVVLSIENEEALGPLTRSSSNHVKAGEPILYVACDTRSVSYEMRS